MVQELKYLKETPSQTAGPYVHIGLVPGDAGFDVYDHELGRDVVGSMAKGNRINIRGLVLDGMGAPVKDVLIEAWQANADGIYPGQGEVESGFKGWGRIIPDFETGEWSFDTIKPGPVFSNGLMMAPHINLWLVARGINVGLNTRIYFADEDEANLNDPVLNLIEQQDRRQTLIASKDGAGYRLDIRLQGDDETVFFDV